MSHLKSGLILTDGEQLVAEIEAELWATSANPIARALGTVRRVLAMIFGFKKTGFIVVTNKRVVEVSNQIRCYCINTGREIKYLLPTSIKEVGYYKKATCGLFCPAYYLYFEGFTQKTSVLVKDADEATVQKLVDSFYVALTASR